ncbi:MAG: hypothetical protein ACLP9L_02320 [Thermoguttaceae bacterium]
MPHGFTDSEHAANVAEAIANHGELGRECWELACAEIRSGDQLDLYLNDVRQAGVGASQRHGAWSGAKIALVRTMIPQVRARLAGINADLDIKRNAIRAEQAGIAAIAAQRHGELQTQLDELDRGRRP